ncbi:MAG: DUF3160 domain-containing protein [Deltaproteobacteria bacterium]|nr:DUF3160 domain-containing protein [Nannocystaceae bacterium]
MAARVVPWAAHFRKRMTQLATIAEHERAGLPATIEELAFFAHTVDRHQLGYGGARSYDGWYAALFYDAYWGDTAIDRDGALPHSEGGRSEPVVADVHTDERTGEVLEVGVGLPELAIVALDVGDGLALYGGPVSSFYAFAQPFAARMTDADWNRRVAARELPQRPAFARGYRPR